MFLEVLNVDGLLNTVVFEEGVEMRREEVVV